MEQLSANFPSINSTDTKFETELKTELLEHGLQLTRKVQIPQKVKRKRKNYIFCWDNLPLKKRDPKLRPKVEPVNNYLDSSERDQSETESIESDWESFLIKTSESEIKDDGLKSDGVGTFKGICYEKKNVESKRKKSQILKPHVSNQQKNLADNNVDCKRFQCADCGKKFRFECRLKSHELLHLPIGPFKCNICSKFFRVKASLKVHMLIHEDKKPLHCFDCNKEFTSQSGFRRHTINVHGPEPRERNFQCPLCSKTFMTKNGVSAHQLVHTGERNFLCEICGADFQTKGNLQSHIQSHRGEKHYQCPLCEKKFSTTQGLRLHSMNHTGLKPHHCNQCEMSFKGLSSLKRHLQTHTDARPYKCTMCEKTFRSKTAFGEHKDFHMGLKRYVCDSCGQSFQSKANMHKHRRRHSDERPFVCEVCAKGFITRQELKLHSKYHTRDHSIKGTILSTPISAMEHFDIETVILNNPAVMAQALLPK